MSDGIKIVNAEIKRNHIDVKGSSYIPLGEDGITTSVAISIDELKQYINNDKTFVYEQLTPAKDWTINHNLGVYPTVFVLDSGGTVVYGGIINITENSLVISFSAEFSGTAYCKK